VWVLVNSNPRLLNATAMAALLTAQMEAVRERADREVGVVIDSFAAGDEVGCCLTFLKKYCGAGAALDRSPPHIYSAHGSYGGVLRRSRRRFIYLTRVLRNRSPDMLRTETVAVSAAR
jgi:hypothetical protein